MADDDALASEGIAREARQEDGGRGNIFRGSELTIHGFPQHDVFDNFLFGEAKLLRLLGDLFLNQRCTNEAGTNHIGPYSVSWPPLSPRPWPGQRCHVLRRRRPPCSVKRYASEPNPVKNRSALSALDHQSHRCPGRRKAPSKWTADTFRQSENENSTIG